MSWSLPHELKDKYLGPSLEISTGIAHAKGEGDLDMEESINKDIHDLDQGLFINFPIYDNRTVIITQKSKLIGNKTMYFYNCVVST